MAKLELSLDTETGALKVSVDGTAVDNVGSVQVYSYDAASGSFEISKYESNDSYRTYTRICAAERAAASAGVKRPFGKVAGYVEVDEGGGEVADAIAGMLASGRKRRV